MLKRALILAVCLTLFAQGAMAASGQTLDNFRRSYGENVFFINDNTGRHLLPLVLDVKRTSTDTAQRVFELKGDVLSVSGITDAGGQVIESCEISLTAPEDMQADSATYNDFIASGYHCYALIMAMDMSDTPLERYELVTAIENAMKNGDGYGIVQRGVYRLSGEKYGYQATLYFANTSLLSGGGDEPEETPDGSDG